MLNKFQFFPKNVFKLFTAYCFFVVAKWFANRYNIYYI